MSIDRAIWFYSENHNEFINSVFHFAVGGFIFVIALRVDFFVLQL